MALCGEREDGANRLTLQRLRGESAKVKASMSAADWATWVQAISAAVQAIGAVVIIGVTVASVKEARKTRAEAATQAKAAAASVDLAERALEQARRQARDAAMPILMFELVAQAGDSYPYVGRFGLETRNVGMGPALNITGAITTEINGYRYWVTMDVLALGAGDSGRIVVREVARLEDHDDPGRYVNADGEIGPITIDYVDVHGQRFRTSGLVVAHDQSGKQARAAAKVTIEQVGFSRL